MSNSSSYSKFSRSSRYVEPKGVKIVIVGPSGVGKTSISNRFVRDQFSIRVSATMGAAFSQRNFQYQPGRYLKMQLWDTAGQEKYKSIARIYYQDAKIAILVYDVTNKISFEEMQVWAEELRNHAQSNIVMAVVGNKTDLLGQTYDEQMDEINYQTAKKYASEIGAIFSITSAKSSKGITELFVQLARRVSEQMQKQSVKQKPKKIKIEQFPKQEVKKVKRRCCK